MLQDNFGRRIDYVRLSVTDRCDLRCQYCLPKGYHDFKEPENWLTFSEISRLIEIFAELGVHRIRITGGEPLTRKNIDKLAQQLANIPEIHDLSLSTNATRLGKMAQSLVHAGISRLNVSLDTLKEDRFKALTGGKLDKVLRGLEAAHNAGFSLIKINMVLMRGINDDEVIDMIEYCRINNFTLRLIETMPVGQTGRNATNHFISLDDIKTLLAQHYNLIPDVMPGGGPARYYRLDSEQLKIGFITPMSQHFCATCNRVRLAADGMLYLCLGHEDRLDLRDILRTGASDQDLIDAIMEAISKKPERHNFNENPQQVIRFMSMTGG